MRSLTAVVALWALLLSAALGPAHDLLDGHDAGTPCAVCALLDRPDPALPGPALPVLALPRLARLAPPPSPEVAVVAAPARHPAQPRAPPVSPIAGT